MRTGLLVVSVMLIASSCQCGPNAAADEPIQDAGPNKVVVDAGPVMAVPLGSCRNPIVISPTSLPFTVTGTFEKAVDTLTLPCEASPKPSRGDVVYRVTPTVKSTFHVSISSSGPSATFFGDNLSADTCNNTTNDACGTGLGAGTGTSSAEANHPFFIVFEGDVGVTYTFTLQ